MKYTGQLVTGDFEENTMTFEIEGEMILQAGRYEIKQIEVGNKGKNLGIANVSGSISVEDTVNAFLDWMKSDDCWINDKDGNRIPDAEIDGKNFMRYTEKYYR